LEQHFRHQVRGILFSALDRMLSANRPTDNRRGFPTHCVGSRPEKWRKAVEETVSLREAQNLASAVKGAAMRYCKRDDDPSLGVRHRAAPARNFKWSEGKLSAFSSARGGWATTVSPLSSQLPGIRKLSPGDVRALRASQMARLPSAQPVGDVLSTRSIATFDGLSRKARSNCRVT
jgi:hypothetical protein